MHFVRLRNWCSHQQRRQLASNGEPLTSVSDRLSQNGVKLPLAEFLGLLPLCCTQRHLLWDWTGAGCRRRRLQFRGRPYLGPCCGRLVAALQVQTGQHAADRVTSAPETARNLRRALSCGPEAFEQRYLFRMPTHRRYYSADCQTRASLVFARFAHDRRFVSFIFLIVVFVLLDGNRRPVLTERSLMRRLGWRSSACARPCNPRRSTS